jgi:hypothetical protein
MIMLKIRNSIAHLMILIAFLGIGAASVLNASRLWAGIIPMLTTMLLLASILGLAYRSGESRAAWAGFAVFGWGFVLLSLFGNSSQIALVDPSQQTRHFLHWIAYTRDLKPVVGQYSDVADVRKGSTFAAAKVLEVFPNGGYSVQFEDGWKTSVIINQFRRNNEEFYFDVGNSLFILLFAHIGMLISKALYATMSKHAPHSDMPAKVSSG